MIPFVKGLVWSLLWDKAAAGRAVRGLVLAVLMAVLPLMQAVQSGHAVTWAEAKWSVLAGIGGMFAGWLRGGEPNDSAPPAGGAA